MVHTVHPPRIERGAVVAEQEPMIDLLGARLRIGRLRFVEHDGGAVHLFGTPRIGVAQRAQHHRSEFRTMDQYLGRAT